MGMSVSEVKGLSPMREVPAEVYFAGAIIRAVIACEATSNRPSKLSSSRSIDIHFDTTL
jgi:hypothetical protein